MNQSYSQYKVSALKTNKNLLMKAFLFLSICLLSVASLWGQSAFHAVQVNVNLIPPYSLYMDDYTTGTRDRIMVTLINKDVQYPSMQVRLILTVKASGFTLKTNDYAVITPIILEPNIPYRLSREEIAEYFDPKNLIASGMGTSVWRQDRKLPEGMIEFRFEAYEHLSNIKLSLPGSGLAWVSTQKPPQLSLPFNEEGVSYKDPLNLMFQWTPRHTGIANVEYIFILKQLWDNGLKAEAAWAYSTEIVRETIKPTSFLYGAAMPALTPGMRYAWAVQAVAKDGMDDIRVFENSGLSEIRSFTLADYCPPPMSINAKTDNGRIALEWVPLPEHIDFTVSYRQKGVEGAEWFYSKTTLPKVILYDVRPGYTYEYRIGSSCKPDNPVYGDTYSIAVPTRDTTANCGETGEINTANTDLLPSLGPNEMFMAADFPVYVTLASGANGIFSGEGYTLMPDMFAKAKLRVKWDNISINTDRRMIKGWVDAIYDDTNSQIANLDDIFEGGAMFGNVKQGITKADVDLSFSINEDSNFTFNPNDGTITVIDENGNESTIDISQLIADREITGEGEKSIFPITVKDKDGNIYEIDIDPSKGTDESDSGNPVNLTAKPVAKETAPIREGTVNYENIAENKAIVTFEKAGKYAFDAWEDYYNGALLIEEKYEKIGNYYVPFKLLPTGKTDIVTARIDIKDSGVNPEHVVFKTPAGTEFNYTYEDNRYTISLTGGVSGDGQEVYALYPGGDGYFNLGKLIVVSYPEKTFNLVAVNVNNANVDVAALSNKLNEIYNPLGIIWKVTGDTCSYSGNTHFMEQGSKLLTAYPDAMKTFQNEYLAKRNIDGKTACLFFFNQYGAGAKNRDADGFMPRNKQFGYMFTQGFASADDLFIGAAHELGHGVFVLKHTFDKDYGIAEKASKNLMDYTASATHIAKWQWDLMHDPGIVVRVFERDEDAMAFKEPASQYICIDDDNAIQAINKYQYFYLPDGRIINREQHQVSGFFTQKDVTVEARGSVYSFKTNGYDNIHIFKSSSNSTVGYGYPTAEGKAALVVNVDGLITNNKQQEAVKLNLVGNKIVVIQNSKTVEEIEFNGNCNCNTDFKIEVTDRYFTTSKKAKHYVNYALSSGKKIHNDIYEETDIVSELVDLVKIQKSTNDKDQNYYDEILADKLKTYEIINGRKFIVVKAPVNVLSVNQDSWSKLTKKVFEESGLGSNDILITIPYVQCKGVGYDKGEYFFMPGLHAGDKIKIEYSKLRTDYVNTQNVINNWILGDTTIIQFIGDVFTNTTKKLVIYKGIYMANNNVEFIEYKKDEATGYEFNKTIKLYKQVGYDELKGLIDAGKKRIKDFEDTYTEAKNNPHSPYRDRFSGVGPIQKNEILAEIRFDNQINRFAKIKELSTQTNEIFWMEYDPPRDYKLVFKEEYTDAPNVKYIKGESGEIGTNVEFYILQLAFNQLREDINYDKINKSWFDGKHTHTDRLDWLLKRGIDKAIYGTLDVLSVALGCVALDVFPDGLGLIYSSIRGDAAQATGYSAGVLIAGSGGVFIKNVAVKNMVRITKNGKVVLNNVADDVIREFIENNKNLFNPQLLNEFNGLTGEALQKAVQKALKDKADIILKQADELLASLKSTLSRESSELAEKFEKDFAGNIEVLRKMSNDDDLLTAWKHLVKHPEMRRDPGILEAVAKLNKNNPAFLSANKDKFERIIDHLARNSARCRTCPTPGTNIGLKYIDEIIDDLDYAVTHYGNTTGFDKLITEMAANYKKADGGAFALAFLKNKGDDFVDQVVSFEKFYLSGEYFEADIELINKLLELKSWNVSTWNNIGAGSYYEQFKAYLRSGKNFEYIINGAKVSDDVAKKKFQKLFKDNAEELFKPINQGGIGLDNCKRFFGNEVVNPSILKNRLDNKDYLEELLRFIKIE